MKWFVSFFTLGLVLIAVSETAYGNEWAKPYEKYWKKDDETSAESKAQQHTDYSDYYKEYEKYWKKDWAKEYGGGIQTDEANEYLDDLFHQLKTKANELKIDHVLLPEINFKLRNKTKTGLIITRVKITNQVLTGISSLKRKGDSDVVIYYGPKRIKSQFKIKDLEIKGQLLVGDSAINESCALFVDIEELTGRLELLLPENKTEPLVLHHLSFSSPRRERPTIEIEEGCVNNVKLEKDLLRKYQEELIDELQRSTRKVLKEALTATLEPLQEKK